MHDAVPRHPKSDACRLCLGSTGEMEHIFRDPALVSTIAETVRLKMFEGDGLPDQVCQPCIDQLNAASRFIQRCHMSDSELRLPIYKECGRTGELEVIASGQTELPIEEPRDDWACSLTPIKVEQDSSGYAAGFSEVTVKLEVVDHTFETVDPLEEASRYEPTGPDRPSLAWEPSNEWCNPSSASWQRINVEEEMQQTETTSEIGNGFGDDCVTRDPDTDAVLPNQPFVDVPTLSDNEAMLICHLCLKSFTTHKALSCHIKRGHMHKNHSKDDSYLQFTANTPDKSRLWCSQCNVSFSQRKELVRHVRTHRGQSSYCCSRCDKGFQSQQALKVHTKTHAKEKRYKCTMCEKSFSLRSYFRVHELTHKRR